MTSICNQPDTRNGKTPITTANLSPQQLESYIINHPKLELHAHVSGSISDHLLQDLIKHRWPNNYDEKLRICKLDGENQYDTRNLDECFALFKVLHDVIDSASTLHQVVLEVLYDFVFRDSVCYIELRSTPRAMVRPDNTVVLTAAGYMQTVLTAIVEFRTMMSYLAHIHSIQTCLHLDNIAVPFPNQLERFSTSAQVIIQRVNAAIIDSSSCNNINTTSQHIDNQRYYHSFRLTAQRAVQSISSFVSCAMLFSIDRAACSVVDGLAIVDEMIRIRTENNRISLEDLTVPTLPPLSLNESSQALYHQLYDQYYAPNVVNTLAKAVVGLDLSGNPYAKNEFSYFQPIFEHGRLHDFPSSLHFAETPNERDSHAILAFNPERLGHAAVLTSSLLNSIYEQNTSAIEICLSSNKACKLHLDVNSHPFIAFLSKNHLHNNTSQQNDQSSVDGSVCVDNNTDTWVFSPCKNTAACNLEPTHVRNNIPIVLCTDDSGVFSSSLVDEWLQLLQLPYFNPFTHHLLEKQIVVDPNEYKNMLNDDENVSCDSSTNNLEESSIKARLHGKFTTISPKSDTSNSNPTTVTLSQKWAVSQLPSPTNGTLAAINHGVSQVELTTDQNTTPSRDSYLLSTERIHTLAASAIPHTFQPQFHSTIRHVMNRYHCASSIETN